MKLMEPNGVISLHSDVKKVMASELTDLKLEIARAEEANLDSPPKKVSKATVQAETMESKKIQLDDSDVSKTTNLGVNLDTK